MYIMSSDYKKRGGLSRMVIMVRIVWVDGEYGGRQAEMEIRWNKIIQNCTRVGPIV